jgi:hypothetical protein
MTFPLEKHQNPRLPERLRKRYIKMLSRLCDDKLNDNDEKEEYESLKKFLQSAIESEKKKEEDEEARKQWELEDFRKRDKLRYYQLHYPQYGLSPETHMHLSEYEINDIIKKLSKNR